MTIESLGVDPTAREPEFDEIVAEAARAIGAPVAVLGFLDTDREWVKASYGWNLQVFPMPASFALPMQNERDVVAIPDASRDPRLGNHPLVAAPPHVRFFAAAPVHDPAGNYLGQLAVIDKKPRTVTREQVDTLRGLARKVVEVLAARKEQRGRDEELANLRASIEDANDRFRDFFEQTDDMILSLGPDGRVLHANQAFFHVLGYARAELSSTPLLRVIDPEARETFRRDLADVFTSAEPQRVETVFVTATGRRVTVEGSLRPKVIDGHAVLARVTFRDISERKQFEAELGNARDAALESARLKTQFLTNVSHEIRTPMNGIVGMIDLLLATPLNAEQQDYAHQARASADQLLAIVNNILYVSNLEAGSLAAQAVDFDMFRTLQRIVEVMKIAALGKDVEVSLVYDDRLPPIFRGNHAKLRQAVTNLMENAVKFTEEGAVVLRVGLQTETETHRVVRFEITDTGIGIAPEDRLLLFEKFSQVEATSTRRFGGVGLGLATARQLVETMGGLIDVESTVGHGSTFWFAIPFPKHGLRRRPIASSDLELRGKRVLLVDSYPTSRKIVRHYLEMTWEMRVDVAEDAAQAISKLRAAAGDDPYRVVVFDGGKDLDPIAFARAVRAEGSLAGTGLVHMVETRASTNDEKLRGAGIDAYVMRPVGQGELFDAVTIALAQDAISLARPAAQPADSRPAPAPVPAEVRRTIRVLLAEDNFLNRKLTMSQLEKLGYAADSVGNGKEAVDAVAKNDYDVILMDCQMPIVDGYEATMEIRKLERNGGRRHRIIAMTANALEGDREKCLAAGMDDYLAKPTKHDELEIALARCHSES